MKGDPNCPRCGGPLQPPGLWSSAWQCHRHGPVQPVQPVASPSSEVVMALARRSSVPLWLPWPLPLGWLVTGVREAGDERGGVTATALACSGPAPLGGVGELVLVAEQPAVGLGAGYAGLAGPDPGLVSERTAPHAKVHAAGHPTALWTVDGAPDRAVFVGEALAHWLWAVLWPETAGLLLLLEQISLVDLRDTGQDLDLPVGALSPLLVL